MDRIRLTQIVVVFCLCLSLHMGAIPRGATGAQAAEGPVSSDSGQGVFTLGVIEVAEETDKPVAPVEKVSSEEMREFSTNRITEALDMLPGVTVTAGAGQRNEKGIYVRGFSPSRVPVFLDGIPIYVPYDRSFDYARFTTFDLSEIIVSKGFSSVLYGANTMGGAINLVTMKPQKPFEATAGAGYGTGDTYYLFGNLGILQKKWYFQAGGSYFDSDYFPMSHDYTSTSRQGGGARVSSYSTDQKVSLKFGFTPAAGHEYALAYVNQQGEKGAPPDVRLSRRANYWLWPVWDKESYYFTSNTPLGEKSYVKSRLYYDKFENWIDFYTDDTYTTLNNSYGARSKYDDWTVGGSIEAGTTLIPKNSLKAAFHYKRDTHNEKNRVNPTDGNPEPWQRSDDVTMSIGLEDTIDITKKLSAIAGVSYDRSEGLRAKDWNVAKNQLGWFDFATGTASSWNPQVGLFYQVNDQGKVYGTVARKTRFPSMREKFSGGYGTRLANPDLGPEKSINYEIGYEDVLLKRIKAKIALFHNDISDAIESVTVSTTSTPSGIVTVTQPQNIGKVKQYGLEASATASITNALEVGANYTYIDWRNESDDPTIAGYKLTNIPEHKVFTYIKYATPLRGLSFLGSMEYNSRRYNNTTGADIAKSFTVVNAKGIYQITKGLILEAGVKNALDKYYEYVAGYPEPGRVLYGAITCRF